MERYLADGTPDRAFGPGGVLTFAVVLSPVAGQPAAVGTLEPLSVSITPVGKVLLAGQLDIDTIDSQGNYGGTLGRQLALAQVLSTTPAVDPTPTPIVTDPTPIAAPTPVINPTSPPAPTPVIITPTPIVAPAPSAPPAPPTTSPADEPTEAVARTFAPSPATTATPFEPVAMAPSVVPSPSAGTALKHSHNASHLRRATSPVVSHPRAFHHVTPPSASTAHGKPAAIASTYQATTHHVVAKRRARRV